MTNFEIITTAAIVNKIFTEAEIVSLINKTGDLPLHTFKEWQRLGYSVKKGEKAKMVCDIWRKTNYKKNEKNDDKEKEEKDDHFYLKTAYFFTFEQVEKIAKKGA